MMSYHKIFKPKNLTLRSCIKTFLPTLRPYPSTPDNLQKIYQASWTLQLYCQQYQLTEQDKLDLEKLNGASFKATDLHEQTIIRVTYYYIKLTLALVKKDYSEDEINTVEKNFVRYKAKYPVVNTLMASLKAYFYLRTDNQHQVSLAVAQLSKDGNHTEAHYFKRFLSVPVLLPRELSKLTKEIMHPLEYRLQAEIEGDIEKKKQLLEAGAAAGDLIAMYEYSNVSPHMGTKASLLQLISFRARPELMYKGQSLQLTCQKYDYRIFNSHLAECLLSDSELALR